MKSVLNVSIAFPPKFDSEGLQVAKYYTYLTESCRNKFHLDVVTSAVPTLNMHYDPALEDALTGLGQIISLKIYENKYINYLLRRVWSTLAYNPDSRFTFHYQWRSVVRQLHRKPDLIYSRSFPASSAIMALKLKRHYNVPWIMHLSDPWADSPYPDYRGGARAHNQRLERLVFEEADVISLTSHKTIEYFSRKYADLNKRYEYYPNVYDPEDVPQQIDYAPPKGRKLRIVHTGGLAGTRSPEPFLKALASLSKEHQDQLEVCFAGWVDRQNTAVIDRYNLDCFRYIGPLESYKDAIKLQQGADVLLLIDFPVEDPELRVYFLSKLLDYHLTGKAVLGVIDAGSECEQFINSQNGHCFERHDVEGLKGHLEWLLAEKERETSYFEPRETLQEFSARHNAERLTQLFEELV